MPWANYHSHSHFCDGKGALAEYVREAIRQGMPSYGFSTHGPVPFETVWNMKQQDFPAYLAEIKAVKNQFSGRIELYAGLEVDYIPSGEIGAVNENSHTFQRQSLDYTIGSIHFTGERINGLPCEIDGPHSLFLESLQHTFQGDAQKMVSRYFEYTRSMLNEACPTILGHLDKIKMQHEGGKLFQETADWYQREVHQTLEAVAATNVIVEVNTRGLYKKATVEAYPSTWILEEIHRKQIPIMINSDAHHYREMSLYFSETAQLLQAIGFKKIMALKGGTWQSFDFDEKGIKW